MQSPQVLWFEDLGRGDVARVGGKNSSLGEMVRTLGKKGVKVPAGFATTADAYWRFLEANGFEASMTGAARRTRRRQGDACRDRRGDPEDDSARRLAEGDGEQAIRARLSRALPPVRQEGARRGGALERHRRGPARRELRRAAGDLPEHPRRDGAARRLPPLLRLALHRPRHQLPHDQGLRPHEGGALDRRAAHGALRRRRLRRHVLHRHGDRLRQGRADQRRLGARRERRAGRRRSRRIPGVQAAARQQEALADHREEARREGDQDDLRERRHADPQRADLEGRARRLRAVRRGDPGAGALGGDDREALRLPDGHGMGQGRRDRRNLHRAGAAGDGAVAARRRGLPPLPPRRARQEACDRPQRRRRDRHRTRLPDRGRERDRPLRRRRDPRHQDHRPGLGADHEARRGDRHRSRRAHLARGDRQPRARPCRRSSAPATPRMCCTTTRRSRSPAPRATRASSTRASPSSTSRPST